MVAIILALVAVVAYLETANTNGTAKMHLLHPQVQPYEHTYDAKRDMPVHRFGHDFGADKR